MVADVELRTEPRPSLADLIHEMLANAGFRPTAIYIHPSEYVRTRRGYAEVEIRAALGGRRAGPGRKRRSLIRHRDRRAAAMVHVVELWRRERADQAWDPVDV